MRISEVYRQINAWMTGGFILMFTRGSAVLGARRGLLFERVFSD